MLILLLEHLVLTCGTLNGSSPPTGLLLDHGEYFTVIDSKQTFQHISLKVNCQYSTDRDFAISLWHVNSSKTILLCLQHTSV